MLVISWITVQSVNLVTEQCRTAHNKVIKTSHNGGGYEGERKSWSELCIVKER